MSDVEALAEVLLASWRSQGMLHPPFDSDHDDAVKDAEAILASDWLAAYVAAERDRAVREALAPVRALADEWDALGDTDVAWWWSSLAVELLAALPDDQTAIPMATVGTTEDPV